MTLSDGERRLIFLVQSRTYRHPASTFGGLSYLRAMEPLTALEHIHTPPSITTPEEGERVISMLMKKAGRHVDFIIPLDIID